MKKVKKSGFSTCSCCTGFPLFRLAPGCWLLLAIVLFALITGAESGEKGPAASGNPDDAVLYYSFDEIRDGMVPDLSGNEYHGLIKGEVPLAEFPEKVEGGLRFTGERCIVIPRVEAMNVGAGGFAVEMVIEMEPDEPWRSKGDYAFLLVAEYMEHLRGFELYIGEGNYPLHQRFRVQDGLGFSAQPLPVGEPVHIVLNVDEDPFWDTMRRELYINGELQPDIKRGSIGELNENVRIIAGALRPGWRHFRGIFRELRLYNRPLSGEDDPVLERGRRFADG